MKIDDFHDRARLWQSRRVVQNAKKYFFHKKMFFFLENKNMTHIVSDIVTGVGRARELPKQQKITLSGPLTYYCNIYIISCTPFKHFSSTF